MTDAQWANAKRLGEFLGSALDRRDGFIHFSSASQVVDTAEKHFSGQTGLVLLQVPVECLGADLQWERSSGGELFPHLWKWTAAAAIFFPTSSNQVGDFFGCAENLDTMPCWQRKDSRLGGCRRTRLGRTQLVVARTGFKTKSLTVAELATVRKS